MLVLHSMTEQHLIYRNRAQSILDALRNCNSGADIHTVNNMRHLAQGIIDLCGESGTLDIHDMLKRLELSCSVYFRNKYSYLIDKG